MAKKGMQVQFVARENGPERLVTEAEVHFDDGPLAGTKLVGFSLWKSPTIAPRPPAEEPAAAASAEPAPTGLAGGYRPWAELLARTFAVDVLACPKCHGRMRLLALVEDPANVARLLAAMGEPTELPRRSPGRGPAYWKSRLLRRQTLGDEDEAQGCWVQETA